jgi:hypothetical protein
MAILRNARSAPIPTCPQRGKGSDILTVKRLGAHMSWLPPPLGEGWGGGLRHQTAVDRDVFWRPFSK